RVQLGLAYLPRDARRRSHQRAALAIPLRLAVRSILGEPPAKIAGLAHVEQHPGTVVESIHARLSGNVGEKVGAELPIEAPHPSIFPIPGGFRQAFWGGGPPSPAHGWRPRGL